MFGKIRNLFMRYLGEFEVWDTSAISTWLDLFIQRVLEGKVRIIVCEGSEHELSVGRRSYETCREAYKFILKAKREGKIILYVTKNNMKSWTVDEQVVEVTNEYHKKGYNVTLVTCDKDMAEKSYNRGLKTKLLAGVRTKKEEKNTNKEKGENFNCLKRDSNPNVPCIRRGKSTYVNVKNGIAVYYASGKRKIGKDNLVEVNQTDVIVYKDKSYTIASIGEKYITLKSICIK